MAIYELLTDYISQTRPVVDFSFILVFIKIILQSAAACITICLSVKRRSLYEQVLLSLAPMVFAITYAFMDVMLGGSFLGGGFKDIEGLILFLQQKRFLKEAAAVLVIFPILSFFIRKWTKGVKSIILLPGDLVCIGLYVSGLLGTLYFAFGEFLPLSYQMSEKAVIWYTYSLISITMQSLLDIMVVVWRNIFRDHADTENLAGIEDDDKKCKKCIAKLLLRGHRVFLYAMIPLLSILGIIIITDAIKNGISPMTIGFLAVLSLPALFAAMRIIFPSTLPAMRQMEKWDDPQIRRREFCQEYYSEENPPYRIKDITFTEHYVIMPSTIKPFIFYFPDSSNALSQKDKLEILLGNRCSSHVEGIAPKDITVLRGMLEKVNKSELKK